MKWGRRRREEVTADVEGIVIFEESPMSRKKLRDNSEWRKGTTCR